MTMKSGLGYNFDSSTEMIPEWWNEYQTKFADAAASSAASAKARISAWAQLSTWIAKNYPDLHAKILAENPSLLVPELAMAGLGGLSDTVVTPSEEPQTAAGQSLFDKFADLAKGILAYQQQSEIIKANIRLAEQGKPPLDISVGSAQVAVRNPVVEEQLKYLVFGVLGLGALYLVTKGRRT